MSYMNLDSLKRYAQKEKGWSDEKFLSENDLNWQKTEKAGIVACYPVGESPLEGTVEFKFTETLPAEGVKGPENPSIITGISNITIGKSGKNIPALNAHPHEGVGIQNFMVNDDGSIYINETTGNDYPEYFLDLINPNTDVTPKFLVPGQTYTMSINIQGVDPGMVLQLYKKDNVFSRVASVSQASNTVTFIWPSSSPCTWLRLRLVSNKTINATIKYQIELGNQATIFEKPAELLNESILSLGNTYYGGSIDLKTGLMTVTKYGLVLNGTENWWTTSVSTQYGMTLSKQGEVYGYDSTLMEATQNSSHFMFANDSTTLERFHCTINQLYIVTSMSFETFKTFLAQQYTNNTPVTIIYPLATPETVQLTPTEILSLPLLDKCTPRVNTIYTDAESIQVGYAKHPSRTAYELQQAIIAGGNH